MARTQVRAFKCAGCAFLTVDEVDLPYRAKVTVWPAPGSTLKAHTPKCLVDAVAGLVDVEVVPDDQEQHTPLPDDLAREQYETGELSLDDIPEGERT